MTDQSIFRIALADTGIISQGKEWHSAWRRFYSLSEMDRGALVTKLMFLYRGDLWRDIYVADVREVIDTCIKS